MAHDFTDDTFPGVGHELNLFEVELGTDVKHPSCKPRSILFVLFAGIFHAQCYLYTEFDDFMAVDRPILRLIDVHKSFGTQKVLDGVNLNIERSKTTVVLGPSGCGKSVMLKHFIGLLKPDSGQVFYEETRTDLLSEKALGATRLDVALIFQMSALFDSMTVRENLEFPLLEHRNADERERAALVRHALETVDLAGVEEKLPAQLSGGQKKRVALARGLITNPKVVLYDEPTTGLDPIRSDGINELILKFRRTLGMTSVVVTHDLVSARKIADRVVMLLGGKIVADGTYEHLETHPNPKVQQFMKGRYDQSDAAVTDTTSAPQDPFAVADQGTP